MSQPGSTTGDLFARDYATMPARLGQEKNRPKGSFLARYGRVLQRTKIVPAASAPESIRFRMSRFLQPIPSRRRTRWL